MSGGIYFLPQPVLIACLFKKNPMVCICQNHVEENFTGPTIISGVRETELSFDVESDNLYVLTPANQCYSTLMTS